MAISMKTKIKYDKFVSEYIKTGNARESAIKAGYSEHSAYAKGSGLLKNPYIKKELADHQQILRENNIADEAEILSYYTNVLRGKQTDEVALPAGVYEIKASTKDRIKAGEMLGKHYAMWTDKKDINANVSPIQIIDDVPNKPEGESDA